MQYPTKFLVSALLLAMGASMAPAALADSTAPSYTPEISQAMYLGALRQDNLSVGVGFATTAPYLHQLKAPALWVQADGVYATWKTDDEAFKYTNKGYRVLLGSNVLVRTNKDVTAYLGVFGNFSQSQDKVKVVDGKDVRKSKTTGFGGGVYLSLYTDTTEDSGGALDIWAQYNQFKHKYHVNKQDQDFVNRGVSLSMNVRHKSLIYVQGLNDGGTLNLGIEPQFQLTTYGNHVKPFVEAEGKNTVTPFNVFNVQWRLGLALTLNSRITEHTVWDSFVGVSYVGTWKTDGLKFVLPKNNFQPVIDANSPFAQGKSQDATTGSTLSSKAGLNQLVISGGFRFYAGEHLNANINANYTLGDNGYRSYGVGLGARVSF